MCARACAGAGVCACGGKNHAPVPCGIPNHSDVSYEVCMCVHNYLIHHLNLLSGATSQLQQSLRSVHVCLRADLHMQER